MALEKLPRIKLRPAIFVCAVFLISATFFWWWLPAAPRFTLGGHTKVRLLDASPDGTFLAIASEDQVQLWRVATGEQDGAFVLPDEVYATHAVFTADSQRLVVNCYLRGGSPQIDHWARIYRVGVEQVEVVLALGSQYDNSALWLAESFPEPTSFRLSPDGKHMAYLSQLNAHSSRDQCIVKVWDFAAARVKATIADVIDNPLGSPLAFSPDGQLLAAGIGTRSTKYQIKIIDLTTTKSLRSLTLPPQMWMVGDKDYTGMVRCRALEFTADGKGLVGLAVNQSAGFDNHVLCWNLENGALQSLIKWRESKVGPGGWLECTRTGKHVLVVGQDAFFPVAHLYELTDPEPRLQESFLGNLPVLSNDGKRLAVGSRRSGLAALASIAEPSTLQVLDLTNLQRRNLHRSTWFRGHSNPLAFAPDDQSLVVGCGFRSSSLYVYDFTWGWRTAHLKGVEARFAPDGKALITYEQQTIGSARRERMEGLAESLKQNTEEWKRRTTVESLTPKRAVQVPEKKTKTQERHGRSSQDDLAGNILGSGVVRVYDHPAHSPVLKILIWAMLPTTVVIFLERLWQARQLRKKRQAADFVST